jgi:hypothetical protein
MLLVQPLVIRNQPFLIDGELTALHDDIGHGSEAHFQDNPQASHGEHECSKARIVVLDELDLAVCQHHFHRKCRVAQARLVQSLTVGARPQGAGKSLDADDARARRQHAIHAEQIRVELLHGRGRLVGHEVLTDGDLARPRSQIDQGRRAGFAVHGVHGLERQCRAHDTHRFVAFEHDGSKLLLVRGLKNLL